MSPGGIRGCDYLVSLSLSSEVNAVMSGVYTPVGTAQRSAALSNAVVSGVYTPVGTAQRSAAPGRITPGVCMSVVSAVQNQGPGPHSHPLDNLLHGSPSLSEKQGPCCRKGQQEGRCPPSIHACLLGPKSSSHPQKSLRGS